MLSEGVRDPIVAAARTALTHRAPIAPRMQALLVLADGAGLTDQLVDAPQRAVAERRIRQLAN